MLRRWSVRLALAGLAACFMWQGPRASSDASREPRCDSQPLALTGSAYAWTNHMPSPAPIDTSRGTFSLVITLPAQASVPSAIRVERFNQSWTVPAVLDSRASTHDSVQLLPRGDPPLWLDRVDSVDVCLTIGHGPTGAIIRLPRVRVIQTA